MTAYLLGLATLPALAAIGLTVRALLSQPPWYEQFCTYCKPRVTWVRDDHPFWPWWVWSAVTKVHDLRHGHMPQIREWRRGHCERTWFGGWKVVR